MTKKLLTGVTLEMNWNSLGGALEGALRYLRVPVSSAWVMGISGHAFRLALPVAGDELAAWGADLAIDFERAAPLYRNLGRKVEHLVAQEGESNYPKRRQEAIKRVQKCIDRGIPAIVYDLHLPQFGLVSGYDDKADTWQVRTLMSGQYGETVPLGRWPVPERPGVVAAVLLGDPTKTDPGRAVLDALRFAVAYAERGDPGDPTGAAHGFAAYERWAAAFTEGAAISASGNAALVQMLQSARRDAAAFLRADASRLLPECAAPLAEAALAYDAETLAISRMMTMFPFPHGGDPTSVASRVVAAGALREALAREQEAIAALRVALTGVRGR